MFERIYAIILRFVYLHKRSMPRIMEIMFWPFMNLLVWGFLSVSIEKMTSSTIVSYLIGGIIFWDVLYRSQQSVSLSITDEFWARNIINLFISPLKTYELVTAICFVGLIKSVITTTFMAILAFFIFNFSLLNLGWNLLPFYMNLIIFGWALGMFTMGIIFRYGRAAEALIWGVPFLIQPFTGVFYPISILPAWIQPISYSFPSTYIFEGMRNVIQNNQFDVHLLTNAFLLNIVWMIVCGIFFGFMLNQVREKGYLSRQIIE